MKTWLSLIALLLIAAAPQPLVVGSVRDQHGVPIGGAAVIARDTDGRLVSTKTDADGTFALPVADPATVRIECRYCRTTTVHVAADGTASAIVKRYDALQTTGPNADDLDALPYTHAESALALTPFTVLENSRAVIPGPQLSSHLVEPDGGLLFDGGIPNYDTTSGVSPFFTTPYRYAQDISVLDPSYGSSYGDRASNGVFSLDPSDGGPDATGVIGSATIGRINVGTGETHGILGYSNDDDERRQRFDIGTGGTFSSGSTWIFNGLGESGSTTGLTGNQLDAGFSGAHAGYRSYRGEAIDVDATVDRGSYTYTAPVGALTGIWSDSGASASATPLSGDGIYGSLTLRSTAGLYENAPVVPVFGAHLNQVAGTIGAHTHANGFDLTGGVAAYSVVYESGNYVTANYTNAFLEPLARVEYEPEGSHFSLDVSANGGYRAATFLERFALSPTSLPDINRDGTLQSDLVYSDGSRVVATFTALSRSTSGFQSGSASSLGGSLAWQVAPDVSVRLWWMHAGIDIAEPVVAYELGATPAPVNVGSAWLTYAAPLGLRFDAIWRQDVIDYKPDAHLDGDVTGPIARNLRWTLGSEKRLGARTIELGVRFSH